MINLKEGDLIAIKSDEIEKYYYAIILSKVIYFGGNLIFAFNLKSENLLNKDEVLSKESEGFNCIVDFIFAKRENRITKLGNVKNFLDYKKFSHYKDTHHTNFANEKAKIWFIYDDKFKEIKRKNKLTEEEKRYPLAERIDDFILFEKIESGWLPELDKRIKDFPNESYFQVLNRIIKKII